METATDPVRSIGGDFHCCKQKREFCKQKADSSLSRTRNSLIGLVQHEHLATNEIKIQNQHPAVAGLAMEQQAPSRLAKNATISASLSNWRACQAQIEKTSSQS